MKVLISNPDRVQRTLINGLKITEKLLSKVATDLSGTQKKAEIYAMPDLGIPPYAYRLCGGFPTGMFAHWESDVPFIPVDTTMNVCGVGIYRINGYIPIMEFKFRVEKALKDSKYKWNYSKGNHMISLMEANGAQCLQRGQYLVLHASANEFQQNNKEKGLFVMPGNWFYDKIKTVYDIHSDRYLRYIVGKDALKFYSIAKCLEKYNYDRNDYLAKKILGDNYDKKVVASKHYGMPTINSVAIGCHWSCRLYPLLTAPGKNIYLIYPDFNNAFSIDGGKKICLSPHGFGVDTDADIKINGASVKIGEKEFSSNDFKNYSINIGEDVEIRDAGSVRKKVDEILESCPGEIIDSLRQLAAFTKAGFEVYD